MTSIFLSACLPCKVTHWSTLHASGVRVLYTSGLGYEGSWGGNEVLRLPGHRPDLQGEALHPSISPSLIPSTQMLNVRWVVCCSCLFHGSLRLAKRSRNLLAGSTRRCAAVGRITKKRELGCGSIDCRAGSAKDDRMAILPMEQMHPIIICPGEVIRKISQIHSTIPIWKATQE